MRLTMTVLLLSVAANAFAKDTDEARAREAARRAAEEKRLILLKLERLVRDRLLKRTRAIPPGSDDTKPAPPTRTIAPARKTTRPRVAVPPGETRFALTLADGTKIIGKPIGLAKIALETTFGSAQVPIGVIQRVDTVPKTGTVKIHFRNGDVVTGKLKADRLQFRTTYGELTFPASELVRLQYGTTFAATTTPTVVRTVSRKPSGGMSPFRGRGLPGGGFGRGGGGFGPAGGAGPFGR